MHIPPVFSDTVKLVSPAFEEIDNLEAALCVESTPDHPFLVCPKHYQELYRQFKSPQPCAGMWSQAKIEDLLYKAYSPDTSTVTHVLSKKSGCDCLHGSAKYCTK